MGLGLSLLRAFIRFYRHSVSGRGPLKRVRCGFAATESCSAYGLRVASESPSIFVAVRLIRCRLRRCGGACWWRWTGRDAHVRASWGDAFDAPDLHTFDRDWAEAHETLQTRAWGRAVWALGAQQRGERVTGCVVEPKDIAGLVLRDADALQRRTARNAAYTSTTGLLVVAGLAAVCASLIWMALGLCALAWTVRRRLGRALRLRARLRAWESSELFSVSGARQPLSFAVPIVSSETSRRGTFHHPSPKGSPHDETRSPTHGVHHVCEQPHQPV
jgi:putative component of membrane protein insertase Oxa1/YidC/SpoIIIJ protein YidD